jgi:hypothetical protein
VHNDLADLIVGDLPLGEGRESSRFLDGRTNGNSLENKHGLLHEYCDTKIFDRKVHVWTELHANRRAALTSLRRFHRSGSRAAISAICDAAASILRSIFRSSSLRSDFQAPRHAVIFGVSIVCPSFGVCVIRGQNVR